MGKEDRKKNVRKSDEERMFEENVKIFVEEVISWFKALTLA